MGGVEKGNFGQLGKSSLRRICRLRIGIVSRSCWAAIQTLIALPHSSRRDGQQVSEGKGYK